MEPSERYLLLKRGLYYAPDRQGYTGVKARAGRYREVDALGLDGVTAIHEDAAPEFSPACWEETKIAVMQAEIDRLTKERDEAAAKERATVVAHVAEVAHAIGWQAGVGAMETAGSIVSFLYANPHRIADFMSGGSVLDWPPDWHQKGYLTWQGMDGKIHYPGEREVKQ